MTDEKWEEKRPTIEGLREMGETFLAMYAINLWDLTIRLEKALDMACEVLENIDNRSAYFESLQSGRKEESMTAEEWKEWCMKDE